MAGGMNRRISAASARAHTRKSKSKSYALPSGLIGSILFVLFVGFLAWAYQATRPLPPKICGSPGGPPVTAPRIKLRDGRYLAYKEHGVLFVTLGNDESAFFPLHFLKHSGTTIKKTL